jgi:type III secretion protein R
MTPDDLPKSLTLVLAVAAVGALPVVFMSLTSFVKISTVLHIVRSAIGAQNAPSGTVVFALAAALTLLVMSSVGTKIADRLGPVLEEKTMNDPRAFVAGVATAVGEPLRAFLKANASARERNRFYELARASRPAAERDAVGRDDFTIVIPAFLVTELLEAFMLGFAVFLPFLVVDLVVGIVLAALGMQAVNATQVSLPFKLLLFVAADGWGMLAQSLVTGYASG